MTDQAKRGTLVEHQARAATLATYMHSLKGTLGDGTYSPVDDRKRRYETLRERYATGAIDLEDFTAAAVSLLREGL